MDGALTMADIATTIKEYNTKLGETVEVMSTSGHFSEDGLWVKSNAFAKNVFPKRLTLPTIEARRANRGVPIGKSATGLEEDYIAFHEAASIVDNFALRTIPQGQRQQVRRDQDVGFGQALSQTKRQYCYDGDRSTSIDECNGMLTRRSSIGSYCLDATPASPTSARTSLFLVKWDPMDGCAMLYPEGSETYGITMEDFGRIVVLDPDNTDVNRLLPVWLTWFYMDFGFMVKDDRNMVRIANIDPTSTTDADYELLADKLAQAGRLMRAMPEQVMIYGNEDGLTFMDKMLRRLDNARIGPVEINNKMYLNSYNGSPLRVMEEISSSEADVS